IRCRNNSALVHRRRFRTINPKYSGISSNCGAV
ncbi:uncharacterized protein METZ01_LOCUS75454, partial [marine metagenome]